MTFWRLYCQGKAKEKDLDDWVEQWHKGDSELSLGDFLGMSEEVYDQWIITGKLPPSFEKPC